MNISDSLLSANTDDKTVTLKDFQGGIVSSKSFAPMLDSFQAFIIIICASTPPWAVFKLDEEAPHRQGPPPGPEIPTPGAYVILSPSGSPINVTLTSQRARPRHPTISNTPSRLRHIPTGFPHTDDLPVGRALSTTHILALLVRIYSVEWVNKGFLSCITDTASLVELGGPTKIDSLQNIILLRSDLHHAWDSYELAVNPDRGYVIVPFIAGYDDVAGKILQLDHIADPSIRPLDDLFRDHFFQAVLKNMKGTGEPTWDYEDALGGGRMDLSRSDVWGSEEGRQHLEFELAHRFHGLLVAQQASLDVSASTSDKVSG